MLRSASHKIPGRINAALPRFAFKNEGGVGFAVMVAGSLLLSTILLLTDGSAVLGAGFIVVLMVVLATVYRLDWGLYIFIAAVLVSDNFNVPGFDPWTFKAGYLVTINTIAPNLGVGVLTPMEIHLLFIIFVWVLFLAVKKHVHSQRVAVALPATFFFLWLIVATVYGMGTGGDKLRAIWEVRALIYVGILFVLVPQIITTKDQLVNIVWVCIGSLTFKAIQAASRFVSLGFNFGQHRALASHEDPIFLITLFIFLLGLVFFGGHVKQKRALFWLLLPLLLGFYAANRRASYVGLLICAAIFVVLLPDQVRAKAAKVMAVGAVLFVVYLTVYWNDYGRVAQFAQAVKSAIEKDPQNMRRDDYLSGLARDQENYNLAVTLRRLPLGLGFGKKHDWAILNYGEFSLKGYITHNQILWLLVKSGPIGFFLFLFFLNSVLFHGAMTFSTLHDPYLKALCAVCIVAIPNQIIASYVDMGLTFSRSMIYLGLLISLIPSISHADQGVARAT